MFVRPSTMYIYTSDLYRQFIEAALSCNYSENSPNTEKSHLELAICYMITVLNLTIVLKIKSFVHKITV